MLSFVVFYVIYLCCIKYKWLKKVFFCLSTNKNNISWHFSVRDELRYMFWGKILFLYKHILIKQWVYFVLSSEESNFRVIVHFTVIWYSGYIPSDERDSGNVRNYDS